LRPDHEPSYYEIALTNRQVLTIFVVLLTCLVAAFLSGVWIGRSDGGERPVEASLGEASAEPATAQMTELNFFTDGSTAQRQGEPKTQSQGEARSEPPPRRPAPAGDEPVAAPPARAGSPLPPAPEPPPATTRSEPPASQPPPQSAPESATGRVIQVFSTIDAAQADQLVRRLGEGGYPAYLVEESLQGRTTYRVRVGPYQQEARAVKIAEELRREYRLETWITSQAG
jgi:DedD protein